jgi:hypothetical protein
MTTSAALLASAFSRGVAAAVLGAYAIAIFLPLVELGAVAAWADRVGAFSGRRSVVDWLGHNPYFAWVEGVERANRGGLGGKALVQFLTAAAVLSALALLVATWRVGREAAFAARGGSRGRRPRALRFEDPVLDRALPRAVVGLRSWPFWARIAAVGTAAWLPVAIDWDRHLAVVGLIVSTWVAAFVVLAHASQTIAPERQNGALGLLLVTPLRPAQIVLERFVGAMAHGSLLLVPGLVLAVAAAAEERRIPWVVVPSWLVGSGIAFFLLAAWGVRVSASATTAGRAVLLSFGLFIGAMAANLGVFAVVATTNRHIDDEFAAAWLTSLPPTVTGFLTVSPMEVPLRGDERHAFVGASIWGLVHLGIGLCFLRGAARSLERNRE